MPAATGIIRPQFEQTCLSVESAPQLAHCIEVESLIFAVASLIICFCDFSGGRKKMMVEAA
jgi:hypothetical protein